MSTFTRRTDAVAAASAARGLAGVLVFARGGGTVDRCADVAWLTGYVNPWPAVPDTRHWTGQGCVAALVTAPGEVVLVANVPESEWREAGVVCHAFNDDPHLHRGIADALSARGLSQARIGLAGRDALSLPLWEHLRAACPDVTFTPADEVLIQARRLKDPDEFAAIRAAGGVADATMAAMIDALSPGTPEPVVAAAGYAALIEAGGAPYGLAMASGSCEARFCPATSPPWRERTLAAGDIWRVDLWGMHGGYLFDLARTRIVGGHENAEQAELLDAAVGVVDAVIACIGPGVPVADAARAGERWRARRATWAPELTKHDYGHFGHALGAGWEGTWIHPDSDETFAAGMYLAVEAVVAHPRVGTAMHEDLLIVTDAGTERTTRVSAR